MEYEQIELNLEQEPKRTGRKGVVHSKTNVCAKYMHENGYETVAPLDFYRLIFPEGELGEYKANPRQSNDEWEYNAYVLEMVPTGRKIEYKKQPGKFYDEQYGQKIPVFNNLKGITLAINTGHFVSMSPISYVGKRRDIKSARFLYALVIELDNLQTKDIDDASNTKRTKQTGLANLLKQCSNNRLFLAPSYIVCSGNGLHLYWLLKDPMPLYENDYFYWDELKRQMTKQIWNQYTTKSFHPLDIQYESLNQPFRIVGSKGKNGSLVEAFKVTGKRYTPEELFQQDFCAVMPPGCEPKRTKNDLNQHKDVVSQMVLSEKEKLLKELYPDWWETSKAGKMEMRNRLKEMGSLEGLGRISDIHLPKLRQIIEKQEITDPETVAMILEAISIKEKLYKKQPNKEGKRAWVANRALYDWWLRKIQIGAKVNHRYYCIYALGQFAVKCDISFEEYEADCWDLFPMLADMSEDEPFTEADLLAAMKVYEHSDASLSGRDFLQRKTGIEIPERDHHGNTRRAHLWDDFIKHKDRETGEIDPEYPNITPIRRKQKYQKAVKEGRVGRPAGAANKQNKSQMLVQAWRKNHPDGKKADCIRDTGLSKPTVLKWWND